MEQTVIPEKSTVSQPIQIIKNQIYKCKRTTYAVQSIFTDKVSLPDALYRIAISSVK